MNSEPSVPEIEANELQRWLEAGKPLTVLDVREDSERSYCAIALPPQTRDLHVPMGRIPEQLGRLIEESQDRPLVVYCHHGVRSKIAGEWLKRQGMAEVYNLSGGIDAWSLVVDPTVSRY